MRIVYIYPALNTVGGADRVIVDKSNYFADKLGYEVYIITAQQKGMPSFFALSEKVKQIDLGVDFNKQYKHSFFVRGLIYMYLQILYKNKLTKTLKNLNADFSLTTISRDIDFIHTIKDGSIKIAEAHCPKHFLRNLHRMEQKNFLYRLSGKIWTSKLEKAVKKFSAFVVLTKQDSESWQSIRECKVIPNPLPFYPTEQSDCKNKQIISVGRLYKEKGYERLIEAWALVIRKHPEWKINIYGDGILLEPLTQLVQKKGLENSFFFRGPVKNITDKYLESAFYVKSSHFEGFGMVLIEAMSCGLPVISFNCPVGPSTIIEDGEDGFLVENGNIELFADKICYLIENEDIRIQMGQMAKKNVSRFNQDIIMQEWINLFHSLKN